MSKPQPGEGKPYRTGRKSKEEELRKAVAEAQKPIMEKMNQLIEVVNTQAEKVKVLEANQTEVVKVLQRIGGTSGGGEGQGSGEGSGFWDNIARGVAMKVMGEGETPMKVALDIAKAFNKTYMIGQSNMLKMMSLLSKGKKLDQLFEEEGEGSESD